MADKGGGSRRLAGRAEKALRRRLKARAKGRVSVVIPFYNVADYLDECLASVRAQTYSDLDIVLVDDGSSDGSADIAKQAAEEDFRCTVISQTNSGPGVARNVGAKAATGEFLTFVDSDDRLPPDAVEALAGSLGEADMAVGGLNRFDQNKQWLSPWMSAVHGQARAMASVEEFPMAIRNFYNPSKLFRRSFWDRTGAAFRDGVTYEDQPLITRLFLRARGVNLLARSVYGYRQRPDSSSISQQQHLVEDVRSRIAAWQATLAMFDEERAGQAVRDAWLLTVYGTHLHWYLNNDSVADEAYWAELRRGLELVDAAGGRRVEQFVFPTRRLAIDLLRRDAHEELVRLREEGLFRVGPDLDNAGRPLWEGWCPPGSEFWTPVADRLAGPDAHAVRLEARVARWLDSGELQVAGTASLDGLPPGDVSVELIARCRGRERAYPAVRPADPYWTDNPSQRQRAFSALVPVAELVELAAGDDDGAPPGGVVTFAVGFRVDGVPGYARLCPMTRVYQWASAARLPALDLAGSRLSREEGPWLAVRVEPAVGDVKPRKDKFELVGCCFTADGLLLQVRASKAAAAAGFQLFCGADEPLESETVALDGDKFAVTLPYPDQAAVVGHAKRQLRVKATSPDGQAKTHALGIAQSVVDQTPIIAQKGPLTVKLLVSPGGRPTLGFGPSSDA
ncbi:MAG: glycosyltransferase [Propionibacteriaceae bacterium]|nr:glycosyltransferase [Propionibacteriaceae bacterium]